MFERLAKFRTFAQWQRTPLSEGVRSYPVHSNDNLPGFRHPEGRGLRPHQALVCHSPDGRHLECRWELATADDRSTGHRGRSSRLGQPSKYPARRSNGRIEACRRLG